MIFPTISKQRISQTLSYPIGAEAISSALADVPQAEHLKIRFFHNPRQKICPDIPYPVVSVRYQFTGGGIHIARRKPLPEWAQPEWVITVSPVPRAMKHIVARLLKEDGLPLHIRPWLMSLGDLFGRQGPAQFDLLFDEGAACLVQRGPGRAPTQLVGLG